MSEIKIITVLFLVLHTLISKIDATPVTVDLSFEDEWDHRIKPHSIPLLGEMTHNHLLPPEREETLSDQPKSAERVRKTTDRTGKKLDLVRSRVSCPICKIGVGLLQKEVEKDTPFEDIKVKFIGLCVAFKVESEIVCTGIFDVFAPEVLAVLKAIKLGPLEICSLILGETCGDVSIPSHDWEIKFPDKPRPEVVEPDIPKAGLPTFKVLHLSDTHYDPDYVVGTPSNCDEPLCCRIDSTLPTDKKVIPAGKWGSYAKCDSPKIIITEMLKHISQQHPDIDYIIWTGDLPPHDIWNQTKESNLAIIEDTVEQMFEYFPRTPIFPALGNHESLPAGNFAPPWMQEVDHSITWLYNKVANHWRKWLPASSGNTVLHGGFYSILIRPGFRIISLNTNYCHSLSWWLLANSTDPAKELDWLIYELQQAEDSGEKVHIIGHIPPGSEDCLKTWSKNFNAIVERYQNVIQGQFYGHSHADEFKVLYNLDEGNSTDNSKVKNRKRWRKLGNFRRRHKNVRKFTGKAVGVEYLGPSVTTYDNFNPAYRIYFVDGEHQNTTNEIVDHETWTMNLSEANDKEGSPKWYRLYSARNDLGMEALRPKNWSDLIDRLVDDPDFFDTFYKFYYRDSPVRPPCDNQCKLQMLCDLRSGRSHCRKSLCQDLQLAFS